MGRFEVQNFRGHEEGKYLCLFTGRRKSSIVSDHLTPTPIPELSQSALHRLAKCCMCSWYAVFRVPPLIQTRAVAPTPASLAMAGPVFLLDKDLLMCKLHCSLSWMLDERNLD